MPATADIVKPSAADAPSQGAPIVVDLGKKPRKQVRQLRRGEGKLLAKVNEVMHELKTAGTISSSSQPVIVVVRQKRIRRSALWPMI
jgi:hypothetical protein